MSKFLTRILTGLLLSVWLSQIVAPVSAGMQTRIIGDNHNYSTALTTERTNLKIGLQADASAPNAAIQILVFAISNTATASDQIADYNAFDLGGVSVKCPNSIPGVFDFSAPIIESAEVANYRYYEGFYHVIRCPYTGTGDASQANFGYTNDNYIEIYDLVNPKNNPSLPNSQVIYSPIWVSITNSGPQTLMTVTSSRSVQMLATIAPQISFQLIGLPGGETFCGRVNKNTTTGSMASFGVVDNQSFADIAQRLLVNTNVPNGYIVTAQVDDQMRLVNQTSPVVCSGTGVGNDACIQSAQVAGMTSTMPATWTTLSQGRGYAYTLENVTGNDAVFDYRDGYRVFADKQAGETPVIILQSSNGRVSSNNVCYRLVPTDTNLDGVYLNNLTYTLTASF